MFTIILLLPLLNFIMIGLFGRFLGQKGVMRLALLNNLISLITASWLIYSLYMYNTVYYVNFGTWFSLEDLTVNFSFTLDKLSLCMLGIILLVSYIVHLYSCVYMKLDPHFPRFMSFLSLFTFFMIILVAADNFVVMFIGWEGVGLCSYLLIGFWHTRIEANKASIKALVINRIGDICLLLGMVLTFFVFRTLDFDAINLLFPYIVGKSFPIFGGLKISSVICLLFLVGIVGKSAQIGLHIWLPDSMEGPTPVSALIHAATMVTAGIYLCIRLSHVFEFSSLALNLMVFIGSLTAFMAGLMGFMQTDIKKIISYSTCTQLGYMLLMCGMSQYDLAFYHLINHAFFKALLFLAGGVLIHIYKNQDLRKMAGLKLISSFLYVILLIGTLASDGFFFFSSVESKDIILEASCYSLIIGNDFTFLFGILSLFLTVCYNSNILDLCSGGIYTKFRVYQIDLRFILTLALLAVFTLLSNYLLFQNFYNDFFADSIFINLVNNKKLNAYTIPYYLKFIIVILFGIVPPANEGTSSPNAVSFIILGLFCCVFILSFTHVFCSLLGFTALSKFFGMFIHWFFFMTPIALFYWFVQFAGVELKNWIDYYNVEETLHFLYNKAYFDWIVNFDISTRFIRFAYFSYKIFDKGLLEILGPSGFSATAWNMLKNYKKYTSGYTYNYICLFLSGVLYIIGIIKYFF